MTATAFVAPRPTPTSFRGATVAGCAAGTVAIVLPFAALACAWAAITTGAAVSTRPVRGALVAFASVLVMLVASEPSLWL